MPPRRRDGHQHCRHARKPMTHATPSIPISRRIQSSVLAALVTAAVMCVFPLLERFTENSPTPPLYSQPIPVKITSLPPLASVQAAPKTVSKQPTPRRQLAPVALPAAIVPPKPISRIPLPPKTLPVAIPQVEETPVSASPVQLPPVIATQENPPTTADDTVPTATTAANDAPSAETQSGETQSGDAVSDMPDGKSLKHPPIPLKQNAPNYPEYARRRNIEGFVILHFIVDIKGRVINPSVQQANPPGHFETAAIRTIRQWQFTPGKNDNGIPVPCRLQMRIDFKLENPTSHGYQIRLQ